MTFWQCASPARWSWSSPRSSARSSCCGSPSLLLPADGVACRLGYHRGRGPHDKDPRTAAVRTIHSSKFSTENSLRPDLFTSLDVAGAQCDSRIALLKSKAMARAHPRHTHEVWLGRRFVVARLLSGACFRSHFLKRSSSPSAHARATP